MLTIRFAGLVPAIGMAPRWSKPGDARAGLEGVVIIDRDRATPRVVVALIDLDRAGASITNSGTEICNAICELYLDAIEGLRLANVRWIYRDSAGRWDEIVPTPRLGTGCLAVAGVDFRSGGDVTWARQMVADVADDDAIWWFDTMVVLCDSSAAKA